MASVTNIRHGVSQSITCGCLFNVQAGPKAGCDVDYGWLPGAAGSDKCYMLVKTDSR